MARDSEKSYSKLEWLFYIIILPIVFISILTFVVLWFLDFEIKDKILSTLNEIPVIEKLIDDEQFNDSTYVNPNPSKKELQVTVDELKNTLSERNISIEKYESNVLQKEDEIALLNQQIEDLQLQLTEKEQSEIEREEEIANLAKVYENMNAKNSASLLSELSTEEAVLILNSMSIDGISEVLAKMDPEQAADLSILLKDQKYDKDADIQALQERINQLVRENDALNKDITTLMTSGINLDYEQLATTFANMDPSSAADALSRMFYMDREKTVKVFSAMDTYSRSLIFNEMDTYDSAEIAQELLD